MTVKNSSKHDERQAAEETGQTTEQTRGEIDQPRRIEPGGEGLKLLLVHPSPAEFFDKVRHERLELRCVFLEQPGQLSPEIIKITTRERTMA